LDARLAGSAERRPGAHLRFEPLVEELRTPAAAFLRPELEQRLARYVAADDSFARDQIAHVLAAACGAAALPALMRARMSDRNEDGDALGVVVLELFLAWPEESLRLTLDFASSRDPRARMVGFWGPCVTALVIDLLVARAEDTDHSVRFEAVSDPGVGVTRPALDWS
jgi:hypothetical protein